jgi:N-acetyl-1-D-myo-inositol-2-amino-2-deoxy-alpha-D-glucopyranoside deacetylase
VTGPGAAGAVRGRRLLLVHAHPDDETLGNGATMARYAAEGHAVTLLTCTRGEEGLVLVPQLAHLAADRDDALGIHRERELAAAMAALGVRDHRFLDTVALPGDSDSGAATGTDAAVDGERGVAVHYRDSGMAWDEAHRAVASPRTGPSAFARAHVDDAAARVAAVVREVRPHVLVTYDPGGGYGHPDHVQAHRVAMRGCELAASPGPGGEPWQVPKVYWNALPEGLIRAALKEFAARGEAPRGWDPDGELPPMVMPDELVTTTVDATAFVDRKRQALLAHATQVLVEGETVLVGDGARQPIVGVEFYRLVRGAPAGPAGPDGREQDLFAGLDEIA